MRLFGGERMKGVVERLGVPEDEPIEAKMISKSIESAQKKVEGRNFGIRKYVLQYDNVMNKQREIIYEQRAMVLHGEDLKEYIKNMTRDLIEEAAGPITVASKNPEEWDLETLDKSLKKICDRYKGTHYTDNEKAELTEELLVDDIMADFGKLYEEKEQEIGADRMREVERMILIRVVDNKWMDHIDAMDQLKNGIGLRALGQQDPAAAYSNEGFDMFELMVQSIKEETVKYCFNITVQTSTERKNVMGSGEGMKEEFEDEEGRPVSQDADMPAQTQVPERDHKQAPVKRDLPKVGRNDPCPCGSGKKYKHCCGR